MQNQVAAIVLVLAIVVGAGLGYLGGSVGSVHTTELRTTTLTTASTIAITSFTTALTTSTVTTTHAVLGRPAGPYATLITRDNLRMELTLNASRVPSGETVQIIMNLTNVLNSHSLVRAGYSWPIDGLIWPPNLCQSQYVFPVGLAIFAGYYVAGNLSSGHPLYIMKPGTTMCPNIPSSDGYNFNPTSNVAILNDAPGYFMIRVQASTSVNGSWSGGSPPYYAGSKFSHFSPGVYTVVEGDEWGDVLFLYFRVT
jgi:hypothetical protein